MLSRVFVVLLLACSAAAAAEVSSRSAMVSIEGLATQMKQCRATGALLKYKDGSRCPPVPSNTIPTGAVFQ
jgi:hypothetical protein